ncbi:hypothetical protein CANTEDRAFT_120956 [Yamadazyma tenuis ATCC 10573]|uniref:Methyltransferase domain-containing protein n=1 Tax=Candida tenuis (strain ATCC 10573 / BCRC 21748 / CBS 615 / JCM 9827 / NBRC 10315 / NRRL Y-1498 / VKM Y-70) TaxID=590646 RepID=G3B125_CANTC|nr:uncharacterized protein CANTEDRAFT_120956 [Yamadazyma tenuis ATCC 10573]EGV64862.1 hypothetical protein CANTEDRAFT_120956 [Yamadazyma tenuis ATCC 10573]
MVALVFTFNKSLSSVVVFAWNCFIKPFFNKKRHGPEQQNNLELFYKNQAHIYDETRSVLLKGRKECLKLAASHLEKQQDLVWVDIGGGTGANIEFMDSVIPVSSFKKVYLVDLSPSLCKVATNRFKQHGWTNITVLVEDASSFKIEEKHVDLITFSYSLSMIPTFYNTIDNAVKLLDSSGVVAAVDFGIQSPDTSLGRINTVGGLINRNLTWWNRNFWRIWFEADKVFLDSSRRNYLEYRFGTVKSINSFNKQLGRIPYYIWIGCHKSRNEHLVNRINCLVTESPYLGPLNASDVDLSNAPISKGHEALVNNISKNLPYPSMYYQKEIWRVYFDDLNPQYEQFKNQYIYAFTWEDPKEDHKILKFNENDTVLAITSAGDNILHYACLPNPPKKIHAVDLNPCQNHLLELKLACFRNLHQRDIWKMFGEGKIENFKDLLLNKLSASVSSNAMQYWMERGEKTFAAKGLYDTGSTRWALRLAKGIFTLLGLNSYVDQLCNCETMEQQCKIWNTKIKPALFNPIVGTLLVGNPIFLWKALGVPANQANMMGPSVLKYVVDTLDPIITRSLISKDNYFYYLTLKGRYTRENCPQYLTTKGYNNITRRNPKTGECALDNIRMHTDTLNDVFYRLKQGSLTIAIIMDHMDWFDPSGSDAISEVLALKNALGTNGRCMLRSAAQYPWYIKTFEENGFRCEPAAIRESGHSIDRTNMYASTWVCTKLDDSTFSRRRSSRISSLKI